MITTLNNKYTNLKFSNNWFDYTSKFVYKVINENFDIHKKLSILEIGTYEGNSTISFAENICIHNRSTITSIDLAHNTTVIHNMNAIPRATRDKIKLIKNNSSDALKNITEKFDIIYIDGSHFPDDVLEDSVLSFQLLNKNGIMIFDDYLLNNIAELEKYLTNDSIKLYEHIHDVEKLVNINKMQTLIPHNENKTLFMNDSINMFAMMYASRLQKIDIEIPDIVCYKKINERFNNICKYSNTLPTMINNESIILSNIEQKNQIQTSISYNQPGQIPNKFNMIINQPVDNIHNINSTTEITLNNNKVDKVALYCPFYITNKNKGLWIEHWLTNVSIYEDMPKFYTISYAPDVNIEDYKNEIAKLDSHATCIKIKGRMYHTEGLTYAHEYLHTNGFDYMVHIEQDVIITHPIGYHLINKMIEENCYITITDILRDDIFNVPKDIDVSIFSIDLNKYDANNYSMYVSDDNEEIHIIEDYINEYGFDNCKTKLPLLKEYSNKVLFDSLNELTNKIYESEIVHWIIDRLIADNTPLINPIYIDSARGYHLHAYLTNKLCIVKNIKSCAKHLYASREHFKDRSWGSHNISNIEKSINLYGYPPIGPNSPNENISFTPYMSNGIDVVIISKNQKDSIIKMVNTLKISIPMANRIFILDRCTDGSKEYLESIGEFYIERTDAVGFCAGSARNLGLKYTNPLNDVLFLDGDRIPHNICIERIIQMVYYFNISMIKNKSDTRSWFVNVPSINTQYDKYNNNVWSSAILLRRTAINEISNIVGNGNIFDPIFDGNWGCEDEYLGDVAYSLGMISGGFPSHIYVEGTTTPSTNSSDEYRNQVEKRNKLRSNLFNMKPELLIGNQPYLSKDERRELVNSIVSERRNMIKHRDRE